MGIAIILFAAFGVGYAVGVFAACTALRDGQASYEAGAPVSVGPSARGRLTFQPVPIIESSTFSSSVEDDVFGAPDRVVSLRSIGLRARGH